METNGSLFFYKSKLSGASTCNLEHFGAELKRIDMKLRLVVMQVNSAQFLVMPVSVAIADGVDFYDKCIAAGK